MSTSKEADTATRREARSKKQVGPRKTESAEPFDRFESLARRLVSVPKKEIDRKTKAKDRSRSKKTI